MAKTTKTDPLPKEALEGHERADVPIETIVIDPAFNIDPRRMTDAELVGGMADNIKEHGLLEPLVVLARQREGTREWQFFLLAGHVRYAALKRLGWKVVPVVIKRNLSDLDAFAINGAENTSRRQVNPFHVAMRFAFLQDKFGLSFEDIAKKHNYSPEYVRNLVRAYKDSVPKIKEEVFRNIEVDESRLPSMAWIFTNSRRTPTEQIEEYEKKYGKGRDARRLQDADEGEPELAEPKKKRPRRRDYDELLKACYDLHPDRSSALVVRLQGFEGSPQLTQRERVLVKATLQWAMDCKKPYPLTKAAKGT